MDPIRPAGGLSSIFGSEDSIGVRRGFTRSITPPINRRVQLLRRRVGKYSFWGDVSAITSRQLLATIQGRRLMVGYTFPISVRRSVTVFFGAGLR